jgi:hypothetical protein
MDPYNQNQNYYYNNQQPNPNTTNNYPANNYNQNTNPQEPLYSAKNPEDLETGSRQIHEEITTMVRLGFIRKVYGILAAQLLLTTVFVTLTFDDSIAKFFQNSIGIFWTCLGVSLMMGITLICCKSVARKVPTNYILLTVWTFCESWMVATCASFYDPTTVFIAAALTTAVTCALTVYACTTKTDFTFCGGMLFAGTSLMFLLGIFFLIFGMGSYNSSTFKVINILYCGLGVFVYSLYLIYDTQLVMGKFGVEYSIEDYIVAAMMIYIDIIQLFLYILRMIGNRR